MGSGRRRLPPPSRLRDRACPESRGAGSGPDRLWRGLGLAILTGLLQAWVNLAVGVIGSEDNPFNLIYLAVIAVAVAGSAIAGFRATGLARAMVATALAQAAVFV